MVLGAALASAAAVNAGDQPLRFIFSGDRALVLGARELISQGRVEEVEWSRDSRYVLAWRRTVAAKSPELIPLAASFPDAGGETSLVLFDRRSHRATAVWQRASTRTRRSRVSWMAGAPAGVLTVTEPATAANPGGASTLLRIDGQRSAAVEIAQLPSPPVLTVAPTQSIACAVSASPTGTTVWLIPSAGAARVVNLPGSSGYPGIRWSADGSNLFIGTPGASPDGPAAGWASWSRIDVRQATVARGVEPPPAAVPANVSEPKLAGRISVDSVRISRGRTTSALAPVWLESADSSQYASTLVCGDADQAEIAPDASGIAYVTDGAAWFVPLVPRPKESVLAVLQTVEARTCRANMAAIAAAQSAFATRYGEFSANPMAAFNKENPKAGGLVGAPEGLSQTVECPSGGSYLFSLQDGVFTVSCPHCDRHATRYGKPEDYKRTLSLRN
jgi:hypothetical protein